MEIFIFFSFLLLFCFVVKLKALFFYLDENNEKCFLNELTENLHLTRTIQIKAFSFRFLVQKGMNCNLFGLMSKGSSLSECKKIYILSFLK